MLNVAILIGRLTADPQLRYSPSGRAVATMRLAVDRGTVNQQGQREADFIDVVCWDKQAETVTNHLQKGRMVAVQGRLQIRQYTTSDGQRREKAEVVASVVRFLDSAKDGARNGGGSQRMGEEVTTDDESVPF